MRETYSVYFTVCDRNEDEWINELELFDRQLSFDTFRDAFRYVNSWFNKPAKALMARYGRSCLQIDIDKNLWKGGHIERSERRQAGVFWINDLYNMYVNC